MHAKSDYFFFNLKQVYPDFVKPSPLEAEIWEEVLAPYSEREILAAIKEYRKTETTNFAPNPAKLRPYLLKKQPSASAPQLPLCPEDYLMKRDIKAGKCRHLFPIYEKAVNYLLDEVLKRSYPPAQFKTFPRGVRYQLAVEKGLFDDFEKTLDLVKNGERK